MEQEVKAWYGLMVLPLVLEQRMTPGSYRWIRLIFADRQRRRGERPDRLGRAAGLRRRVRTQLKACRLVLTMAFAAIPELHAGARQAPPDRRTLRIVP